MFPKKKRDFLLLSPLAIFFKRMFRISQKIFFIKRIISFVLAVLYSLLPILAESEVIDRIIAIVNDEVITLTDIKVAEKFQLFKDELKDDEKDTKFQILEKMIDQKLVIQMAPDNINVTEKELNTYLTKVISRIGRDKAQEILNQFGMDWEDIKSYLREGKVYQKIISERFDRNVIVSIKEIKTYYNEVYRPSVKKANQEPKPMLEILDLIESNLKQEKTKQQIKNWLMNLRNEALIQIKLNDEIFNNKSII